MYLLGGVWTIFLWFGPENETGMQGVTIQFNNESWIITIRVDASMEHHILFNQNMKLIRELLNTKTVSIKMDKQSSTFQRMPHRRRISVMS